MFNQNLPYAILAHNLSEAYYWGMLLIILIVFFYYLPKENLVFQKNILKANQFIFSLLLIILTTLIFTFFPIERGTYADREGYLYVFNHMDEAQIEDRFWFVIYYIIRLFSKEQFFFFAALAILYVGLRYLACIQFSKDNNLLLFLMILSSFLFFSYGHNTMRSGVASSFLILAFSLFFKNRAGAVLAFVLMWMSVGIHKSMIIPAIAFLISFFYNNSKVLIFCWILAFYVSFLLGDFVSSILGDIVTENAGKQAGGYITSQEQGVYDRGFRLDFILYSFAPIAIGGYYIFKKNFQSREYLTLYNTYIITNIFFVLVIRANFIDRFGYLSWMLMPIILIYPLIKQKIFERQSIVIAFTLMLNELFTFFMYLR